MPVQMLGCAPSRVASCQILRISGHESHKLPRWSGSCRGTATPQSARDPNACARPVISAINSSGDFNRHAGNSLRRSWCLSPTRTRTHNPLRESADECRAPDPGRSHRNRSERRFPSVPPLLGTNVRLRPRHPLAARRLSPRSPRNETHHRFRVRPLPRHLSRRSRRLRRRRATASPSTTFPTSIRSTTACSPIKSARSSNSASCPRS